MSSPVDRPPRLLKSPAPPPHSSASSSLPSLPVSSSAAEESRDVASRRAEPSSSSSPSLPGVVSAPQRDARPPLLKPPRLSLPSTEKDRGRGTGGGSGFIPPPSGALHAPSSTEDVLTRRGQRERRPSDRPRPPPPHRGGEEEEDVPTTACYAVPTVPASRHVDADGEGVGRNRFNGLADDAGPGDEGTSSKEGRSALARHDSHQMLLKVQGDPDTKEEDEGMKKRSGGREASRHDPPPPGPRTRALSHRPSCLALLKKIFSRTRWHYLFFISLYAFFIGPSYLNWAPLRQVLFRSGAYSWTCDPDETDTDSLVYIHPDQNTCKEQRLHVGHLFTICAASDFGFSFFGGLAMDWFGPKIASLLGSSLMFSGWLLLSVSSQSVPLYIPGFVLFGLGIDMAFYGTLSVATLFPGHENTVMSIIVAMRALSYMTPVILDALVSISSSHLPVMLGYALLALLPAVFIAIIYAPWRPFAKGEEKGCAGGGAEGLGVADGEGKDLLKREDRSIDEEGEDKDSRGGDLTMVRSDFLTSSDVGNSSVTAGSKGEPGGTGGEQGQGGGGGGGEQDGGGGGCCMGLKRRLQGEGGVGEAMAQEQGADGVKSPSEGRSEGLFFSRGGGRGPFSPREKSVSYEDLEYQLEHLPGGRGVAAEGALAAATVAVRLISGESHVSGPPAILGGGGGEHHHHYYHQHHGRESSTEEEEEGDLESREEETFRKKCLEQGKGGNSGESGRSRHQHFLSPPGLAHERTEEDFGEVEGSSYSYRRYRQEGSHPSASSSSKTTPRCLVEEVSRKGGERREEREGEYVGSEKKAARASGQRRTEGLNDEEEANRQSLMCAGRTIGAREQEGDARKRKNLRSLSSQEGKREDGEGEERVMEKNLKTLDGKTSSPTETGMKKETSPDSDLLPFRNEECGPRTQSTIFSPQSSPEPVPPLLLHPPPFSSSSSSCSSLKHIRRRRLNPAGSTLRSRMASLRYRVSVEQGNFYLYTKSFIKNYMLSFTYLPIVPYFTIALIRSVYFNDSSEDIVPNSLRFLHIILGCVFFAPPFAGIIADYFGIIACMCVVNSFGSLVIVCGFVAYKTHVVFFEYCASFMFMLNMALMTNQVYFYVADTFPQRHLGKLCGFACTVGGVISLSVTKMFEFSVTHPDGFTIMLSLLIGLSVVTYLLIFCLYLARRRTLKKEQKAHHVLQDQQLSEHAHRRGNAPPPPTSILIITPSSSSPRTTTPKTSENRHGDQERAEEENQRTQMTA